MNAGAINGAEGQTGRESDMDVFCPCLKKFENKM